MTFRKCLAAVAFMSVAACNTQTYRYPGQIATTFDGNKQLVLSAAYSIKAGAIAIRAWADVRPGSGGVLELTGPYHMSCTATFRSPIPGSDFPDDLPSLDIGEGSQGAGFHAPSGHYTARVTLLSGSAATLQESFDAGISSTNALTLTYEPPGLCILVADTQQQLTDLLSEHVHALDVWVGRLEPSSTRSQLDSLVAKAKSAVIARDWAAALASVSAMQELLLPVATDARYADLYRDIRVCIALLTQPTPSG